MKTPAHRRKRDPFGRAQIAPRRHVDPGPDRCEGCVCDRALCEADETGGHCADQSCGSCLHGCPDPDPRGCRYCRRKAS